MKRNVRSYKCTDKVYREAAKYAEKKGTTVANLVEGYLTALVSIPMLIKRAKAEKAKQCQM